MATFKRMLWPLSFVAVYYFITIALAQPWFIGVIGMLVYLVVLAIVFRDSVYLILGNITHHKDLDKGLSYFKRAINMDTKNPRAYINYAILILRKGEYEEAISALEKAESLGLDVVEEKNLTLSKGTAYWMAGERQKAIETLESMEEKFDYLNPDVLATLGYLYFAEGDDEKSEEMNVRAIEEDDSLATVWDTRGQMYHKNGDLEEAISAYKKALDLNPHSLDSLYGLSILEEDTHIEKAYGYILRAKELNVSAMHTVTEDEITKQFNHLSEKREKVAEEARLKALEEDDTEEEIQDTESEDIKTEEE